MASNVVDCLHCHSSFICTHSLQLLLLRTMHESVLLQHTDCAVCAPNHSKSMGKQCTKCKKATSTAIDTALAAVVVLLALAVWFALTQLLGIGDGQDAV